MPRFSVSRARKIHFTISELITVILIFLINKDKAKMGSIFVEECNHMKLAKEAYKCCSMLSFKCRLGCYFYILVIVILLEFLLLCLFANHVNVVWSEPRLLHLRKIVMEDNSKAVRKRQSKW